jgi:hypothetical protein
MVESLQEVYNRYKTYGDQGHGDKGTDHNYIDYYSDKIKPLPNKSLLEIGISRGYSIRMWKEYLPESNIWGVDIDTSRIQLDLSDCNIIHGDASKECFLDNITGQKFDYIIDDGSHQLQDQKDSFSLLFPFLSDHGIYFIEDVEKAYINDLNKFFEERDVRYEVFLPIEQSGRYDDIIFTIYA